MIRPLLRREELDWSEVWDGRLLGHRRSVGGGDSARAWQDRESALRYWQNVCDTQGERIARTLQGLDLRADSRVLDIGAGPGVLAIPLALRAAHVTAVDAAPGMIRVLEEKAAARGLANIRCVPKRWEEVDVVSDLSPPYDIVLASLSLDMLGIREAIARMEQACSRHLYLFWFAGEPAWEPLDRAFHACLHGIPFNPLPKCELLLPVLRQAGIRPEVTILPYLHVNRFSSLDEAVEHFSRRYRVSTGPQEALLRSCLDDLLAREDDFLVLRSPATYLRLHWEVRGRSRPVVVAFPDAAAALSA